MKLGRSNQRSVLKSKLFRDLRESALELGLPTHDICPNNLRGEFHERYSQFLLNSGGRLKMYQMTMMLSECYMRNGYATCASFVTEWMSNPHENVVCHLCGNNSQDINGLQCSNPRHIRLSSQRANNAHICLHDAMSQPGLGFTAGGTHANYNVYALLGFAANSLIPVCDADPSVHRLT